MTSPAHIALPELPRGYEFPPRVFSLSGDDVARYLGATADEGDYGGAVPPLAALALALRALQEQIALPEGSLHTGQELEQLAIIRTGERLTLTGRVAQRSERQGFVISVLEVDIGAPGTTAVRGRTTIMAPVRSR